MQNGSIIIFIMIKTVLTKWLLPGISRLSPPQMLTTDANCPLALRVYLIHIQHQFLSIDENFITKTLQPLRHVP
jgi:hypothetical protein